MDEALFYLALLAGAVIVVAFFAAPISRAKHSVAVDWASSIVAGSLRELPRGSVLKVYASVPLGVSDGRIGSFYAPVNGSARGTCLTFVASGGGVVVVEGC